MDSKHRLSVLPPLEAEPQRHQLSAHVEPHSAQGIIGERHPRQILSAGRRE